MHRLRVWSGPIGRRLIGSEGPKIWSRNIALIARAACKAHPEKAAKHPHGEDAFFVGKNCAGVADGVSAWAQMDVDAGLYARELMEYCQEELESMEPDMNPKVALQNAYKRSLQSSSSRLGTCTVCLVALNGKILHAANIGDSAFIVIRQGIYRETAQSDSVDRAKSEGWEVVYRSADMQKFFNCPDQLGSGSPDRPSRAETYELPVRVGDIIIVATDGLFDNFSDNEICVTMKRLCAECMPDGEYHSALKDGAIIGEKLNLIATSFVNQAHVIGMSESARTPFGKLAIRAGYYYEGGKLDDCCVIVGVIVDN